MEKPHLALHKNAGLAIPSIFQKKRHPERKTPGLTQKIRDFYRGLDGLVKPLGIQIKTPFPYKKRSIRDNTGKLPSNRERKISLERKYAKSVLTNYETAIITFRTF